MMMMRNKHDIGNISIQSDSTALDGVEEILQATYFDNGEMQYQRLDVQSQLDRFNAPMYFHALVEGSLRAVYVLDRRQIKVRDHCLVGYYRGALAVDTQWQGCGVGKALTSAARQWLQAQTNERPTISYGCIDQANSRSLKLLESGGATVGPALCLYMMYRQWPAVRCDLQPLEASHHDQISVMEEELYGQCQVRDVSPSSLSGYVLQDRDGVVISARLANVSFRINRMSKVASWCTELFVKPFPFARRRFDPDCFRYVSLTNVVIRPGYEAKWNDFVSTVLALNNCHFGVLYVDPRSKLFTRLQASRWSNRFMHSSRGSIRVVWQSFSPSGARKKGRELLDTQSPVHVWPVDA